MEQFGQYRLEQMIGRGGMGEVFRAHDTVRDRVVALKRLPAHLAADETFKARFRKESALAARLSEPHIIPIHDFGEIDGQLFIDMRLVDGRDLGTVLADGGPLAPEHAVAVVAQVAGALDAAHAAGLVHRDIKPSNVLITGEGGREFVYLVDFGIARSVTDAGEAPLTSTGATVGTVDYMAPERFTGTGSDRRADVYALACLLFEALTGRKPFRGDGLPALIHSHLNAAPPSPSRERPGVPAALDGVVATGMAKDPADRYPSAGELADAALAALAGGRPAVDATTVQVGIGGAGQPLRSHPSDQRPTARLPQQASPPPPQWPPSQTMVQLPTAGFTPPAGAGGPAPRTGWRSPRLLAAAALGAVVVAIVVAVALLSGDPDDPAAGTGSPAESSTVDAATDATTDAATDDEAAEGERPESLPGGDPAADQALWDALQGTDALDGGCSFVEPADADVSSTLSCNAVDPAMDYGVEFEAHGSPDAARAAVDARARELVGDPGTCENGGTYTGDELAGRYAACGIAVAEEPSRYVISWSEPDVPILATVTDDDDDTAWSWFAGHDPF